MAGETRLVRYIISGVATGAVAAFKETEGAATKAGAKLEETGGKLTKLGSGMTSFGYKLSSLSLPLIAIGGYAIKSAMDFQQSMTLIQTQAGASSKEVKWLSRQVEGIKGLGEGPEELAKALYPIESAGLRGARALQALRASAKGAQVGNTSLAETANVLAGAVHMGFREVKSAGAAMGIMNGIVGLGKMHLEDLNEAMTTGVGPQAARMGMSFRDLGATIDAMTRQNIPATTEATRLRLTLTQMTAPTGEAKEALRRLGLEQFSLANDLKKKDGMIVALRELRAHLHGLSEDQQHLDLAEIFGKSRGSSNIIGLLSALPEMEKIRGELNKYGEGQLNQAFATRTKNASFQMAEALSQGKKALVGLGQVLIPVVIPALEKMFKFLETGVKWWKELPGPVKTATVYFGMFLAVGGPLLIFIGKMTSATGMLIKGLGKLMTAFGGVGPAAKTAAADAADEEGTFAVAGTSLGTAMGVAAVAALLAYMVTNTGKSLLKGLGIRPSDISGGEYSHHSILHEAMSANPLDWWATQATATNKYERRGMHGAQRRAAPLTDLTWNAQTKQQLQTLLLGARTQVHEAETEGKPLHIHLYLDGKQVTEVVTKNIRNNPVHARPVAEGTARFSQARTLGVG